MLVVANLPLGVVTCSNLVEVGHRFVKGSKVVNKEDNQGKVDFKQDNPYFEINQRVEVDLEYQTFRIMVDRVGKPLAFVIDYVDLNCHTINLDTLSAPLAYFYSYSFFSCSTCTFS